MASSGWQGEKTLYSWGKCSSLAFDLRVDSISHSGGTVYVSGVLRFVYHNSCGGTGYYNYTMSATPSGASTVSYGTWSSKGNGYYQDRSFSGSFSAPASATSGDFNVTWSSTSGDSGTSTWRLSFGSSATAPSGLYANNISTTWNSVSGTVGLTSYGSGGTSHGLEFIVLTQPYAEGKPQRYSGVYDGSMSCTTTVDNNSAAFSGGISIKGLGLYYLGVWATNGTMTSRYQAGSVYTKPAPSQFSYTDPGGTGSKTYPVMFVGDTVNNNTSYDTASLTRTIRYKIDNGSWVYVDNETIALLDYVTSFNVTVPAGSVATIEGYMTYHGQNSETTTVAITNSNVPKARIYGSVNNASKRLAPLYGTFGNYFDGRHYLERSNASVDINGDQVTITKTSSGSSTWTYVFFLIDSTDELINKEVTLSGEFSTSGSFTSGPRLFWMKSNNVDWLSIVNGMEYQATGTNKKFSITGTIPARPSGAGKLGLGLYANGSTSSPQGSYTVYNNVELKANVKNLFNYIGVKSSVGGLTPSQSADGTITVTGTLSSNYQHITSTDRNITGVLEDGVKYTISAANTYTPDLAIEIRAKKTGESAYSYWNTRGQQSSTFTVDKTTYEKYEVYAITSTTASWGTSSKTVSNKFQLEKGPSATSFAPFVDTKTHKLKKIYGSVSGRSKLIYNDAYQ